MIVAKSFLELNEPLVSTNWYRSHCCIYRTIPEPISIGKGKIVYIKKNKGKINYQLQSLKNVNIAQIEYQKKVVDLKRMFSMD